MASQAPFGVLNNPVKVPSGNNSRTVGCTGGVEDVCVLRNCVVFVGCVLSLMWFHLVNVRRYVIMKSCGSISSVVLPINAANADKFSCWTEINARLVLLCLPRVMDLLEPRSNLIAAESMHRWLSRKCISSHSARVRGVVVRRNEQLRN